MATSALMLKDLTTSPCVSNHSLNPRSIATRECNTSLSWSESTESFGSVELDESITYTILALSALAFICSISALIVCRCAHRPALVIHFRCLRACDLLVAVFGASKIVLVQWSRRLQVNYFVADGLFITACLASCLTLLILHGTVSLQLARPGRYSKLAEKSAWSLAVLLWNVSFIVGFLPIFLYHGPFIVSFFSFYGQAYLLIVGLSQAICLACSLVMVIITARLAPKHTTMPLKGVGDAFFEHCLTTDGVEMRTSYGRRDRKYATTCLALRNIGDTSYEQSLTDGVELKTCQARGTRKYTAPPNDVGDTILKQNLAADEVERLRFFSQNTTGTITSQTLQHCYGIDVIPNQSEPNGKQTSFTTPLQRPLVRPNRGPTDSSEEQPPRQQTGVNQQAQKPLVRPNQAQTDASEENPSVSSHHVIHPNTSDLILNHKDTGQGNCNRDATNDNIATAISSHLLHVRYGRRSSLPSTLPSTTSARSTARPAPRPTSSTEANSPKSDSHTNKSKKPNSRSRLRTQPLISYHRWACIETALSLASIPPFLIYLALACPDCVLGAPSSTDSTVLKFIPVFLARAVLGSCIHLYCRRKNKSRGLQSNVGRQGRQPFVNASYTNPAFEEDHQDIQTLSVQAVGQV